MRLAAVQHDIVWCDRDANFDHLGPKIADAAALGADLVVLTETFSTGFAFGQDGFVAEEEGGPSASFLTAQAAAHGVWVAGSCPEIRSDQSASDRRPSNTFVFAGPDGTLVRYHKIHPFSFGGEDRHVRPGERLITVEIAGFRITPFVCYDLRFATEFFGSASTTDLFLIVANWPSSRREHWSTLLRARAIENQAFVAGVNRVGSGGGLDYAGDSAIFDPIGRPLATAAEVETILCVDIEASVVADTRDRFPFMADRRFGASN